MNAQQMISRANESLVANGLAASWKVTLSSTRRTLGLTLWLESGAGEIRLSKHAATYLPDDEVIDLILHEVAHAIAGHKAAHGPAWQAVCRRLGCNPSRFKDAVIPGPWRATCAGCGTVSHMYRKPARLVHQCVVCLPAIKLVRFQKSTLTDELLSSSM